jgi:hypothetical protein
VRRADGDQFFRGLGERQIQRFLAVLHALEQELQAERRLADAGIALQQIHVIAGESSYEDVVESLDACRRDVSCRCIAHRSAKMVACAIADLLPKPGAASADVTGRL